MKSRTQSVMTLEQYRVETGGPGKPKRIIKHEESEFQRGFFSIIDDPFMRNKYPWLKFIYSVPNGACVSEVQRQLLSAEGLRPGCPDVVFPFARHGYGGAYMENKSSTGRVSPEQTKFMNHLRAENYCVTTTYHIDEQIVFASWYLGICLGADKR